MSIVSIELPSREKTSIVFQEGTMRSQSEICPRKKTRGDSQSQSEVKCQKDTLLPEVTLLLLDFY